MTTTLPIPNIRFVMVNTSHPGNIGAVSRAMKNMRLDQLVLVDPVHFPDSQATARASGADDVLANARVCDTLEEALAGCDLVFGASARLRRLSWPLVEPREFVQQLYAQPSNSRIAVVFGREHSGLTNDELERCHYLLWIPSNPAYSSLNIAAAAQIIAYEIHQYWYLQQDQRDTHTSAPAPVAEPGLSLDGEPFADAEDMERFYQHLNETLADIGFLQTEHPRKMLRRLRRLFNRARPDRVELNILRGILTTIQKQYRG
ncbi:MAG: tRNA (cytosine(32)/uridine(32)-2'-O)-methyltransferase TrmJ [Gammaproteobacteria bacterium]|jgi:TrmH family RNA methyltransferase